MHPMTESRSRHDVQLDKAVPGSFCSSRNRELWHDLLPVYHNASRGRTTSLRGDEPLSPGQMASFCAVIGYLLSLSRWARLDLSYAVTTLIRSVSSPGIHAISRLGASSLVKRNGRCRDHLRQLRKAISQECCLLC